MYGLVVPTAINQVASQLGKKAASTQPTREKATQAYFRTRRLVAIIAILGAIVYGFYATHQHPSVLARGAGAYRILQVQPGATAKQISQGYRKLSLIYHPDKNPDASEYYELLNYSYELLKSSKSKFLYDRYGLEALGMYEKLGEKGFNLICTNNIFKSMGFWVMSSVTSMVSLLLGSDATHWQLLMLATLAGLELTFISREWFEWYAPLPIFQCVQILRTSLPVIMGCIPLLIGPGKSQLENEVVLLEQTLTKAKILAEKRLDLLTGSFQSDELTMKKLQNLANAALQ